jgi:hypothetical protein
MECGSHEAGDTRGEDHRENVTAVTRIYLMRGYRAPIVEVFLPVLLTE